MRGARCSYAAHEMSDLWPRIEPLLARVEKPARYIGMEQGSLAPAHGPGRAAFLLIYPDTYEIGLPNQGLQILYELLNERADAVAERAYAPWIDMERSMRAAGVPLFSVDTHRAGGRLRRARLQPLGRARLHEPAQPRRSRGRARPQRGPRHRASDRDRGRSLHVQPRAARGVRRRVRDRRRRRSHRRDRRCRRRVEARRPASPRSRAARSRDDPRRVRAGDVRRRVRRAGHPRGHAALSRRPRGRRQAHGCRPRPSGRTRRTSSCRSSRSCTTA